MKRAILITVALCVLILFGLTSPSAAQTPTPTPTPTFTPTVDVMYTGKLLGYFRVPSLQQHHPFKGCPARSDDDSAAARTFLDWRTKNNNAILVSTGDNFSPQLEARIFSDPPGAGTSNRYIPGNKELWVGDGNAGWVFYRDLALPQHRSLAQNIADGFGTIPTDNVGCFLRAAGFDAIVPGKHDFYFGAERVREFARFLAGTHTQNGSYPVQMLGANLVLTTVPILPEKIPTSVTANKWFGDWPDKYPVLNLKDGGSAYPWFTYAKIQVMELRSGEKPLTELAAISGHNGTLPSDLEKRADAILKALPSPSPGGAYSPDQLAADQNELTQLKQKLNGNLQGMLCESPDGPNDLPRDLSTCKRLVQEFRLVGNKIVIYLEFPIRTATGKGGHYSTLTPGKNYQLCAQLQGQSSTGCHRFSSHTPFLYFPHTHPQHSSHSYTDPDPYVLKGEVAIFGVVDPTLGEQIGILNFGWNNKKDGLTSRVSVEEPQAALQQQLDYFEKRHPHFSGLKVLLAQMNPQRARALSARVPNFQIVVSAADQEQGTSEVEISSRWLANGHKRAFMAVPTPYFNSSTRTGSVHFGTVRAEKDQNSNWELEAQISPSVAVAEPGDPATQFWRAMTRFPASCLPSRLANLPPGDATNQTYLKWQVLCAMREHTAADVALIQKRDLYEKIPAFQNPGQKQGEMRLDRAKVGQTAPHHPNHIQQTLDRLIWKGDLITLLYVPGSALKKALQQSDKYIAEEGATLSLAVERGRQLEMLGIRKHEGEYFVNDLPLEDNKLYAVATTDYIGAGDTGYPDLVKEARNPRSHPAAFTGDLTSISSLVCRQYFLNLAQNPSPYCLEPIVSGEYLDQTTAQRVPPYKRPNFFARTSDWIKSAGPADSTPPKTVGAGIEQTVHRRSIWRLSFQNISFGFKGLGNNITGKEQKEQFAGIPISGVTAKESETFTLGANARLVRSWDRQEFFVASGLEYDKLSEGDSTIGISTTQRKNRFFAEPGFIFWRTPGRALPNFGVNLSLFSETQLFRPFSEFELKTKDEITEVTHRLRVNGKRSWIFLPRLGLRLQGKTNLVEGGAQYGRAINVFNGYRFSDDVICTPDAEATLSDCVKNGSDPATGGIITKDSQPIILTQDRPRAGVYWKIGFSQQIIPKLKYEFEDASDFFFVNFRQDTSVDTRFRSISKHRLSFDIWPSFSIGPVLDLLIYQNKRNEDWLIQRTFSIEAKINFDIFNRREIQAQFQHKP